MIICHGSDRENQPNEQNAGPLKRQNSSIENIHRHMHRAARHAIDSPEDGVVFLPYEIPREKPFAGNRH
jgi:hypothetical protein